MVASCALGVKLIGSREFYASYSAYGTSSQDSGSRGDRRGIDASSASPGPLDHGMIARRPHGRLEHAHDLARFFGRDGQRIMV